MKELERGQGGWQWVQGATGRGERTWVERNKVLPGSCKLAGPGGCVWVLGWDRQIGGLGNWALGNGFDLGYGGIMGCGVLRFNWVWGNLVLAWKVRER